MMWVDITLIVVVGVAFIAVAARLIYKKVTGKQTGCDCGDCSSCCGCSKKKTK